MNTFQQEYKGALTVSNWNMVLINRTGIHSINSPDDQINDLPVLK